METNEAMETMKTKSEELRSEWQAALQREREFLAWFKVVKQEAESLTPRLVDDPIGVTRKQAALLELMTQAHGNRNELKRQVAMKKTKLKEFDRYRANRAKQVILES